MFLNIEDHNSFNDPHGPTFNTDLHVSLPTPFITCAETSEMLAAAARWASFGIYLKVMNRIIMVEERHS